MCRNSAIVLALTVLSCAPRPARRLPDEIRVEPDAAPDNGGGGGTGGRGGTGGSDAAAGGTGGGGAGGAGGGGGTGGGGAGGGVADAAVGMGGRDGSNPDTASPPPPPRDAAPPERAPPDAPPDNPVVLPDAALPPPPRDALFVAASTTLVPADQALRGRLQAAGLQVVVILPGPVTAADAAGKALVVISGTIDSPMLGTKLRDVDVPVLSMEPNIMNSMRLSTFSDTLPMQTSISIVQAGHPLAGGLSGTVTVYSAPAEILFGTPASGAVTIATAGGSAAQSAIYGYETGAILAGGTPAPAKRIAFFANDNQPGLTLAADGLRLFDAAVAWALTP